MSRPLTAGCSAPGNGQLKSKSELYFSPVMRTLRLSVIRTWLCRGFAGWKLTSEKPCSEAATYWFMASLFSGARPDSVLGEDFGQHH